jgi:hypothetical protein
MANTQRSLCRAMSGVSQVLPIECGPSATADGTEYASHREVVPTDCHCVERIRRSIMKNMKSKTTIVLIAMILLASVALTPAGQRTKPQDARATDIEIFGVAKSTSYQGVSFYVDQSLAKSVAPETIPASTQGKPSDIWPEHIGFTLIGLPRPRSLPGKDPHIRVFSIPKFREALGIATKEYQKSLAQPAKVEDWSTYLDTEVNLLKSLLKTKPVKATLRSFLTKQRGAKGCGGSMPFLPLWEACQAFVARPRYVKFKNGEGVLFLTQQDVSETSQVTNQGLEYAFQGITNDGQSYVYAEFSVAAPFLPKGDEAAVRAWNEKNYLLSHRSAEYQRYVRPIVVKLEALPANQFEPKLQLLDQLVESLAVRAR